MKTEETAREKYNRLLSEFEAMNCLAKVKKNKTYQKYTTIELSRFFIRGTKYYFDLELTDCENLVINWRTRQYSFKNISLSEILESKMISIKAKEQLLFNIDLFI